MLSASAISVRVVIVIVFWFCLVRCISLFLLYLQFFSVVFNFDFFNKMLSEKWPICILAITDITWWNQTNYCVEQKCHCEMIRTNIKMAYHKTKNDKKMNAGYAKNLVGKFIQVKRRKVYKNNLVSILQGRDGSLVISQWNLLENGKGLEKVYQLRRIFTLISQVHIRVNELNGK